MYVHCRSLKSCWRLHWGGASHISYILCTYINLCWCFSCKSIFYVWLSSYTFVLSYLHVYTFLHYTTECQWIKSRHAGVMRVYKRKEKNTILFCVVVKACNSSVTWVLHTDTYCCAQLQVELTLVQIHGTLDPPFLTCLHRMLWMYSISGMAWKTL